MYAVIVRTERGQDAFCSFDGSEDYELDASKANAEQLLDFCRTNWPENKYSLVQVTVLES